MQNKYDLIVPLGFNCASAAQLRLRGLRLASLPFDWISRATYDFKVVLQLIEDEFSHFLTYDDLLVTDLNGGNGHITVKNIKTEFTFPHDFYTGKVGDAPNKQDAESVTLKYHRRISRFFSLIERADSILFVSNADYNACRNIRADLEDAQKSLQDMHPNKSVDIFAVAYKAPTYSAENLGDHILCQFTSRYWTADYDVNQKMQEYSFLDNIALSGRFQNDLQQRTLGQLGFWERLVYSRAKRMLKYLSAHKIKFPIINDYE